MPELLFSESEMLFSASDIELESDVDLELHPAIEAAVDNCTLVRASKCECEM